VGGAHEARICRHHQYVGSAASDSDRKDCQGNSAPDQKIAACTRVIDDSSESASSRANAYSGRGVAYFNKKDQERAMADHGEAIKLDPKNARPYHNRGLVYAARRDYDAAIAEYEEAIKLDSKYVSAYNNRGLAYASKKDYDRAMTDYSQATPNSGVMLIDAGPKGLLPSPSRLSGHLDYSTA
jgi:tetratricopeptide (TPR) repeat protein